MVGHWTLLRMYGAELAKMTLEVIEEEGLAMRVMEGAWITTETHAGADGKPEVITSSARVESGPGRGRNQTRERVSRARHRRERGQ